MFHDVNDNVMQKTVVIGRAGEQPFTIDVPGVSNRHARLIVEDDIWTIEDLNSTNGTFVQMADGSFVRVGSKRISPTTRVRLGDATALGGITFSARKVLGLEDNYRDEFAQIEKTYDQMQQQLQKIRGQQRRRRLLIAVVPLVLMMVSIPMQGMAGMWFMRGSLGVTSVLSLLLLNGDKERKLMEQNKKLLVCPRCGRPLSEYDIKSHSHVCGAKG